MVGLFLLLFYHFNSVFLSTKFTPEPKKSQWWCHLSVSQSMPQMHLLNISDKFESRRLWPQGQGQRSNFLKILSPLKVLLPWGRGGGGCTGSWQHVSNWNDETTWGPKSWRAEYQRYTLHHKFNRPPVTKKPPQKKTTKKPSNILEIWQKYNKNVKSNLA